KRTPVMVLGDERSPDSTSEKTGIADRSREPCSRRLRAVLTHSVKLPRKCSICEWFVLHLQRVNKLLNAQQPCQDMNISPRSCSRSGSSCLAPSWSTSPAPPL